MIIPASRLCESWAGAEEKSRLTDLQDAKCIGENFLWETLPDTGYGIGSGITMVRLEGHTCNNLESFGGSSCS